MREKILFFVVIFFANVIQGITGFAGTILAMPPSLMLVGYSVAKPVLNLLGLFAGILVFVRNYKECCWDEVKKIVLVMLPGLIAGIAIKSIAAGEEHLLTLLLAVFVLLLSIQGMWKMYADRSKTAGVESTDETRADGKGDAGKECHPAWQKTRDVVLLLAAGIMHGTFVSGGPLLIGYLTKRVQKKESFRVTISTVWILLNGMLFIDDIVSGCWSAELVVTQLAALPFFLVGMYLGARLCKRMSQRAFLWLTYILLFIAAISLLLR